MMTKELIATYYDLKWAEKYKIAKEDIKDTLKLITEVFLESDYDLDDIETVFFYLYHNGNPPKIETILDKFTKAEKSKNAGELVEFSKY